MYKFILSFILFPVFLSAQIVNMEEQLYTIQVGTFYQPKLSDFAALQSIGLVYAEDNEDNFYNVFLGTYKDSKSAQNALEQVKHKGYSAFLVTKKKKLGHAAVVIQLLSAKIGQKLDWERLENLGTLYSLTEEPQQLKLVTGPFTNSTTAQNGLAIIQQKGYKDAFVKIVNSHLLSPIGYFEKGITPLSSTQLLADEIERIAQAKPDAAASTNSQIPPSSEIIDNANIPAVVVTTKEVSIPKSATVVSPTINPTVKRTSALDLQMVLKTEGYYTGSLDGFYGNGTKAGYDTFIEKDYQFNKYQLLSAYSTNAQDSGVSGLQALLNSLDKNDAGLIAALRRNNAPIAQAYMAYWLLVNQGPSKEVNRLMNTAIKQSFSNKQVKNAPPFDFNATYDYTELQQLLLHIRYLYAAPENSEYAIPCWLFERHPKEANVIFSKKSKLATLSELKLSGCEQFEEWQSLEALRYFLAELQPNQFSEQEQNTLNTLETGRSFLYLFPEKLTVSQKKEVDDWKVQLWAKLLASTNDNPVLEKYYPTLKVLFFHSQLLLEDYYMQKGFSADESEGLALSVLKTYVEVPLKVYLR